MMSGMGGGMMSGMGGGMMSGMGGGMPVMGGGMMPGMGGGMGGGVTDGSGQAEMMAALQDPNDPGAGPAMAALQAAKASGQGQGSCLVAAARAYEQATGRPMPGAPTGQVLDAAQGFNTQLDVEKAEVATQAGERAAARKAQQGQEVHAEQAKRWRWRRLRGLPDHSEGCPFAADRGSSG